MRLEEGRHRIFITVMTYPAPSRKSNEIVCTAGITEDGRWVRLYPVEYRYLDEKHRYKKWQWIEADLGPASAGDQRRESHKVIRGSIALGERLDSKTDKIWALRRALIDPLPAKTYLGWKAQWEADREAGELRTSLGVVRPTEILDLTAERREDGEWSQDEQAKLGQLRLFGPEVRKLKKLPYRFRIKFRCEDSDKPHEIMIEDWEIGLLYWNCCDWGRSDDAAAIEKVKERYLGDVLDLSKRDVRFFMGTTGARNTWLIVGLFAPPKLPEADGDQLSLF